MASSAYRLARQPSRKKSGIWWHFQTLSDFTLEGGRMGKRPKIAAIATIYHKYSHTQHIVDRFLEGYGWNSRHHHPPMDLVSLYVEQVKDDDLSRERLERFPSLKVYPTIAEALTIGGDGTCRRWCSPHRRTRRISHQREGTTPLSAISTLQTDG